MRLATEGLAENVRNAPITTKDKIISKRVLSTVHHHWPIVLRLFLEKEIKVRLLYLYKRYKADDEKDYCYNPKSKDDGCFCPA